MIKRGTDGVAFSAGGKRKRVDGRGTAFCYVTAVSAGNAEDGCVGAACFNSNGGIHAMALQKMIRTRFNSLR